MINYKVDHPLIDSCWSEKYDSGIIQILFNCKDRGLQAHHYGEGDFYFTEDLDNLDLPIIKLESEHLDKIDAGWYNESVQYCKDQISFFFIPMYLVTTSEMWNRLKEKRLKNILSYIETIERSLLTSKENDIWEKELIKLKLSKEFYETN